jgi:hypothetical protein
MRFQRRGGRKRIGAPDGSAIVPVNKPMPDSTLLKALARPWRRQKLLDAGVLRLDYANRGNGELEQELCEPHPAAGADGVRPRGGDSARAGRSGVEQGLKRPLPGPPESEGEPVEDSFLAEVKRVA